MNLQGRMDEPAQKGQAPERGLMQEAPTPATPSAAPPQTQWNSSAAGDSRLLKPGRPLGQVAGNSTSPTGLCTPAGTQLTVDQSSPNPSSAAASPARSSSVPAAAGVGNRGRAPLGFYGVAALSCFGVAAVAALALVIGASSGGGSSSGTDANAAPGFVESEAPVGAGSLPSVDDGSAGGAGAPQAA